MNLSPHNCSLVNVNGQIVAFCKTNDFTTYVRQAINNEMFWRDLLQRYSITDMVQSELNNKLPNQVRVEAQKVIREDMDNYTRIQLPSHVAKSLSEQISGFLNNNSQMNEILSKHSSSLNQQLTSSATNTLNRVTNEEQYHLVTSSHLKNMEQRFDNWIIGLNKRATELEKEITIKFNSNLESMKQQVANELQTLTDTTKTVTRLEQEISTLKWALGLLGVGTVGIFIYTLTK